MMILPNLAAAVRGSNESDSHGNPAKEITSAIEIVIASSCVVSMICSSLIIISYIAWKDIRTKARQLLLFLSIVDFLSALGYLYGAVRSFRENAVGCVVQSSVVTFANCSCYFWTLFIAIFLYISIVKADTETAERLTLVFHIIAWGVPLLITAVALCLGALGYDDSYVTAGWCWVNLKHGDFVLWVLLGGKLWELLTYIVLPIVYISVKCHISQQTSNDQGNHQRSTLAAMQRVDMKLTIIPLIFVLLRVWGTIRFFLYVGNSSLTKNVCLIIMQGIGNSSQGTANCILFCFMTKKVRCKLINAVTSCCCCYCCYGQPPTSRQNAPGSRRCCCYCCYGQPPTSRQNAPGSRRHLVDEQTPFLNKTNQKSHWNRPAGVNESTLSC